MFGSVVVGEGGTATKVPHKRPRVRHLSGGSQFQNQTTPAQSGWRTAVEDLLGRLRVFTVIRFNSPYRIVEISLFRVDDFY